MSNSFTLKPSVLIIFGVTGDLAKRKVLPALYSLCRDNILSPQTRIVGVSRQNITANDLLQTIHQCLDKPDIQVLQRLRQQLDTCQVDPVKDYDYRKLKNLLLSYNKTSAKLDWLFYLAIPPQVYSPIIKMLGKHQLNLNTRQTRARLLIEKPFGYDLVSARDLIKDTDAVFSEQQIFRIDHYLAKDTVQNILAFRHNNPVFASQWDAKHISRIHVIAKEKIGIENRINFYEQVGAMRDLVQSHLLQLLALSAMDMPSQLDSESVHQAKYRFLRSLVPPGSQRPVTTDVMRGQYAGYRQEVSNPESSTETYVSMLLTSRHRHWQNCLFQLTTGKALDQKETVIQVYFGERPANILRFRLQPDEGIDINFQIEQPGLSHQLHEVKMNFSYNQVTGGHDAYERVLIDALRGDRLLFATRQEVLASWRLLQPILDAWETSAADLTIYPVGSAGPDTSLLRNNLVNPA